eukprot:GHVU01151420.1.p1 GENE.GHVU01151420.1~~GHVU01151420.1.p1  ORF type:complete len:126 (-),score=2.92 GHVU01151420.1:179-556(-)
MYLSIDLYSYAGIISMHACLSGEALKQLYRQQQHGDEHSTASPYVRVLPTRMTSNRVDAHVGLQWRQSINQSTHTHAHPYSSRRGPMALPATIPARKLGTTPTRSEPYVHVSPTGVGPTTAAKSP